MENHRRTEKETRMLFSLLFVPFFALGGVNTARFDRIGYVKYFRCIAG
jgi:hypothetical protein